MITDSCEKHKKIQVMRFYRVARLLFTAMQTAQKNPCTRKYLELSPKRLDFSAEKMYYHGILVKYSGKGYFLKELSFSEFCMLRELRFMLESGIIKKLIEKSSDEELQQLLDTVDANWNGYPENLAFHFRLAEMTKNVLVEQEIKNIFNRFIRQRTLEDQHFDITESHRSIVKALLARDEKLALKCLKDDLIPPHDEMIWT